VPTGFRFLPLAEVLATQAAPDWLIRDYLEADVLAVLFGASGSMKSFVALDMSFCVATGLPWHGAPVPRPGPVFYIAGEGFRGLAKRLRALVVAHGVVDSAIPLFTSSAPAQFLDSMSAEAVTKAIEELTKRHGPPRLIVVDTLNRCFGPGNENDTKDMTAFIVALDALRGRFRCAMLVIHHTGLQDKERARGASALRAALDFEYRLDVHDRQRTLKCTKSKDHDAPPAVTFEPITVGTGWRDPETGQETTSCVLRKTGDKAGCTTQNALSVAERVALDALTAACAGSGRVSRETWRAAALPLMSAERHDAKKRAFNRALKNLVSLGMVHSDDEYFKPEANRDNRDIAGTSPTCPGGTQAGQPGHTP
jgi:hypothetical protein